MILKNYDLNETKKAICKKYKTFRTTQCGFLFKAPYL